MVKNLNADSVMCAVRSPIDVFWLTEGNDGRLFLLGYPLELTPRERFILECVVRQYPETLTPSDICKRHGDLSPGSVPVHINAINKKSSAIGGRKLISSQRSVGYTLNRFM